MANDIEFVIFYTAFILFVVYLSGLAGYSILTASDLNICSEIVTEDCVELEFSLNPFTAFSTFGILLTVNSEYAFIFGLLITPYLFGLVWIFFKWLRGTG